ncbi:hypothetical protein HDF16_005925 [Granulicella aggregans]|uniref:Uncharacterized protein n=1 Tax=Granulicella aggregans TaxID=474949 RepID=A0A7W8E799_9BACT|nr:hypothetical protein [Granulicella aggregans]MBB5061189.1 hypothetical protein [Granulicella aggregans]
MNKLILRLVVGGILLFCSSTGAHAQSYYNDENCDIGYADCNPINTDIIGDPALDGAGPQRGRCGTVEIESTLNGMYSTGSSVYPTDTKVSQALAGATSGVWYPWTFTEWFFPPSGPPGSCSSQVVRWIWQVSIRTTNYRWTGFYNPVGLCEYTEWCATGETATCSEGSNEVQYVTPDDSFGQTGCATWYYDDVLALKDSAGTYCLPVGVGDMAYIPHACT